MAFVSTPEGKIFHTSVFDKVPQDVSLETWARSVIAEHEDIAHVHLTITTKDGHKHHYMQGSAHASDCAVHNAPAYDPGPCDCGAEQGCVRSREDGARRDSAPRQGGFSPAFAPAGADNLGRDHSGQYRDGEPER